MSYFGPPPQGVYANLPVVPELPPALDLSLPSKLRIKPDPTAPPSPYKLIIIKNGTYTSIFDCCDDPVVPGTEATCNVFQLLKCGPGTLMSIESIIKTLNEAPVVRKSRSRCFLHAADSGGWADPSLRSHAVVLKLGKTGEAEGTDSGESASVPMANVESSAKSDVTVPPVYSRRRVGADTDLNSKLYGGE
ncbi:hypothetical protein TWF718_002478 [Orbilia javanica]|uniref:Uncharacterized protein n=1 Tax=Orbilia javanica TaxID=47235 RepID=A0AAN8MU97_9PEZI